MSVDYIFDAGFAGACGTLAMGRDMAGGRVEEGGLRFETVRSAAWWGDRVGSIGLVLEGLWEYVDVHMRCMVVFFGGVEVQG